LIEQDILHGFVAMKDIEGRVKSFLVTNEFNLSCYI